MSFCKRHLGHPKELLKNAVGQIGLPSQVCGNGKITQLIRLFGAERMTSKKRKRALGKGLSVEITSSFSQVRLSVNCLKRMEFLTSSLAPKTFEEILATSSCGKQECQRRFTWENAQKTSFETAPFILKRTHQTKWICAVGRPKNTNDQFNI